MKYRFRRLVPLAATPLDIVRLGKKRWIKNRGTEAQRTKKRRASTGASSFCGFPKPWASMSFFASTSKATSAGKTPSLSAPARAQDCESA